MRKILLLAKDREQAFERQRVLQESLPNVEVEACCNEEDAVRIALTTHVDLGIFHSHNMVSHEEHFGELIRTSGLEFPMIVTGQVSNAKDFFTTKPTRTRTIILFEPVSPIALVNVSKKLMTAGALNQPLHPRFTVNQVVKVEKNGRVLNLSSRVKNLSVGGARVDFDEKVDLDRFEEGDLLRIRFSGKVVNSQVVWTNIGNPPGKNSLGLSFLKSA